MQLRREKKDSQEVFQMKSSTLEDSFKKILEPQQTFGRNRRMQIQ